MILWRIDSFVAWVSLFLNKLVHFAQLLHFAWVVDDAQCILHGHARLCVCLSVCLSLAACPYYTDPDVTWRMVGMPSGCALLGGYAIGPRVSLLWQHSPNAKCQRVLVLSLCLVRHIHPTLNSQLNALSFVFYFWSHKDYLLIISKAALMFYFSQAETNWP